MTKLKSWNCDEAKAIFDSVVCNEQYEITTICFGTVQTHTYIVKSKAAHSPYAYTFGCSRILEGRACFIYLWLVPSTHDSINTKIVKIQPTKETT